MHPICPLWKRVHWERMYKNQIPLKQFLFLYFVRVRAKRSFDFIDEHRLKNSNLLTNIIFVELAVYYMKAKYYSVFYLCKLK